MLSKGDEAAARLNESLASVHFMYAAFERKQFESVAKFQREATQRLASSVALLREIHALAGPKPVSLTPKDEEEKEILSDFQRNIVGRYKLPLPKTQKDLANIALVVVSDFNSQLDSAKIDPRSGDLAAIWGVMRAKIYLEQAGLAVSIVWSKSRN